MARRSGVVAGAALWLAACSGEVPERPSGASVCSTCAPDLAIDAELLATLVRLERVTFAPDSCDVRSGCAMPGERTVLHLAGALRNVGDAPLELHAADFTPRCGDAPALAQFFRWRVLDAAGTPVREGEADLGCIADGRPPGGGGAAARFSCAGPQGLQPGWLDDGPPEGTCSFADVTGLAPGAYRLEVLANAKGLLAERSAENNAATIAFEIPASSCGGATCGGVCCPQGVGCVEGRCALPDLTIDAALLQRSLRVDEANFAADDCAVAEGCVGGTGLRRLLRFSTATPNVGGADLFVGNPNESPEAQWSACHGHFHMLDYAAYRLLRSDGSVAAEGHKQAFCLMDTEALGTHGPTRAVYDCGYQGISRGWSDTYGSGLDCQWVDVTGVPEGAYQLEVVVNGAQRYPESDVSNNVARVPVFLSGDPATCVPTEEVCGDGRDQDCDGVADDGCPPLTANDTCAAALALDGSGTWTGAISAATARPAAGSCGGAGGALHFALNVLADEIVYLSTYGSAIDTVLRVEQGACGASSETACIDDACGGAQSHFAGVLARGTYHVIVQAKDVAAAGTVRLAVQRSGCGGARPIDAPGSYAGDTIGAGADTTTSCGLGGGADELWYFATCPGTTEVSLSTCEDASYDTVLELRRGSCRGRTEACNDDAVAGTCAEPHGSRIAAPLAGEGLWFVVVDGYLSTHQGAYRLDVSW